MKRLHRPDLYGWSRFDEERNIDFHSVLWVRAGGSVIVDPLPLSDHDRRHLVALGGASIVVITNSDHIRGAAQVIELTGARCFGPAGESANFPLACDRWLGDGAEVVPGLRVLVLQGSKTPGELALVLEDTTLITGDLIRAHEGGKLCLLPDSKLSARESAIASVKRVAAAGQIEAVLTGDGWPIFRDGSRVLADLLRELGP